MGVLAVVVVVAVFTAAGAIALMVVQKVMLVGGQMDVVVRAV